MKQSFSFIDFVIPENNSQFLAPIFGVVTLGFWYIIILIIPRLDINVLQIIISSGIFYVMMRMAVLRARKHIIAEVRAMVLFVFLSLFLLIVFDTFDLGISAKLQEYLIETWKYFIVFSVLGLLWIRIKPLIVK